MNDLVDRYLWAVSRRLPESIRADVTDELRSTITDMVEVKESENDPDTDTATRQVLLELGDPVVLARTYTGERRYVIGPAVFDDFKRVLTGILVVVAPAALVALTVVNVGLESEGLLSGLLHAALSTVTIGVHVVFWTGLAFAIADRAGVDPITGTDQNETPWHPDQLSPVPRARQIGLDDLVWGVGMPVAAIAWLLWQHFRGVLTDDQGAPVPLFHPDLWALWIPMFFALMLATALLAVMGFRVGRWTLPMTVANVLLNGVLAAYCTVLLISVDVVNPEFGEAMNEHGNVWEPQIVGTVVLASILAVCVWDSVRSVRKHWHLRRQDA